MATRDPFESYLKKAADLFESGDVVQAGQIWQAILKKSPDHSEARAGLYKVKLYFDARATQDGLAEERKAQAAKAAAAEAAASGAPANEIVRLLEQGCTLYDAGHVQDAIAKWEQVLAKDPGNTLAKGYITGAQRVLGLPVTESLRDDSPRATSALPADLYLGAGVLPPTPAPSAPAPAPAPPPPAEPTVDRDEVERLLKDGCTLYDMGQPEDALRKWEKLLSLDPDHALAKAYLKDARRDLGLDTLSDGAIPVPVELPPTGVKPATPMVPEAQAERIEQLIREGTQLYDMGMNAEAVAKWEQVLILVPGHAEAESYLAMARRETTAAPAPSAPPPVPAPVAAPLPAAPPADDSEPKLRKAESLLHQGRFEESAFLFQEVLKHSPQNFRALQGLHQAQSLLDARQASHLAPPEHLYPPTPPLPGLELPAPAAPMTEPEEPSPSPVQPPATLTAPAAPPRKGLELPKLLSQMEAEIPAFLKQPKVILAIVGGVVLLNVLFLVIRAKRRDTLLAQNVAAFRASAQAPVARNLEVVDLAETPAAIRREAESVLGEDPLRAYYRAQELIRQSPLDGPSAQLMGRASAAMGQAPEAGRGSVREVEKLLQGGELEGAEKMLRGLLFKSPDDADLKARYARLALTLAELYALKERWGDAEDQLKRVRAMYPTDKSWNARLQLLGRVKTMGGEERKAWIQFLG